MLLQSMMLIATLAFDGETTGTDTGTDEGTEEATNEECGGTCEDCSEPAELVWITSPANGATVESPFTVTIEGAYYCWADDCGCSEVPVDEVHLRVDGSTVASGEPGSFQIELEPGEYTLTAVSYLSGLGIENDVSEPITVTVLAGDDDGSSDDGTGDGGSGDGGSGGNLDAGGMDEASDGGSDTGASIDEGSDRGCSCTSSSPTPIGAGLALLGLLALRRRRAAITRE
jgi:MYXO-CTERM domain-containing protein